MLTLSKGFKLPEDGDFGDVWFDALEDDIQQLNDHTHDGSNSAKLASTAVETTHQTVTSGSFASQGDGYYRATVSLPAGTDYDTLQIVCRDPSTGDTVYLRTAKLSDTQAYIYTNFVQNFEVYFLS